MALHQSSIRCILLSITLLTIVALMLQCGTADEVKTPAGPLDAMFEAHGGLKQWRKQRQMTYTLNDFPLSPQVSRPNRSTVDLKNRFNRIEGEGFVVAFDGTLAWCTPGADAVGLPPRFFCLGSFYFIGMPFVFADPGVIVTDAGEGTFRGKTYRLVKIGYESGIGHTEEDEYSLFIDLDTDRLALINHSVTEIGLERVTWVFDEWQQVDGLLIPAKMTFHDGWNPNDPGDGASCTIVKASFSTKPPEPSIYEPPVDAVIEGAE